MRARTGARVGDGAPLAVVIALARGRARIAGVAGSSDGRRERRRERPLRVAVLNGGTRKTCAEYEQQHNQRGSSVRMQPLATAPHWPSSEHSRDGPPAYPVWHTPAAALPADVSGHSAFSNVADEHRSANTNRVSTVQQHTIQYAPVQEPTTPDQLPSIRQSRTSEPDVPTGHVPITSTEPAFVCGQVPAEPSSTAGHVVRMQGLDVAE